MRLLRVIAVVCCTLAVGLPQAIAGLHYSGDEMAPLPSQWRGFLLDQRQLRMAAVPPRSGLPASPLRVRYEKAAKELEEFASKRALSADERADLGALYLRLGNIARAIEVLRNAQREHPVHYRIVSNLGTAWQLHGDLDQAAACLQEAVRLAPGKFQAAEEMQFRLVRQRKEQAKDNQSLDDLLGVQFVDDKGAYEPGKLGEQQKKKLSAESVANVQLVALWLPADGRLLWQLGELAAVYGDLQTGAAILDGCVTEFGMRDPELRRHRLALRAAADKLGKTAPTKTQHEGHAGALKTRSSRPLVSSSSAALPAVDPDGINVLPWSVVTQTSLDRQYKPTFPRYLRELDGKKVTLSGFMQPVGGEPDQGVFLVIEYPVGCWYCEMPGMAAMIYVEMPQGRGQAFTRDPIQVTGTLKLNANDPEDFLYAIRGATVKPAE